MNKSILFHYDFEKKELQRHGFVWAAAGELIDKAKESQRAVVCIITAGEKHLLDASREFVECGRKHAAKPLYKYFIPVKTGGKSPVGAKPYIDGTFHEVKKAGEGGISKIIRYGYQSEGQLTRSVRDFLIKIKKLKGLYLIITGNNLFKNLTESVTFTGSERVGAAQGMAGRINPGNFRLDRLQIRIKEKKLEDVLEEIRKRYIGTSQEVEELRCEVALAATEQESVLITGESGTGKEIIARAIHDFSKRRGSHFVPVNIAAISPAMFEVEFYGVSSKGGGGLKDKIGLFDMADKGTLFMDEIGDMQYEHQGKILRTIETGKFYRVGGDMEITVDVRSVAATNRNLADMMEKNQFKSDLFFRLDNISIKTAPLRSHPEDIPLLIEYYWKQIADNPKDAIPPELISRLQAAQWPGNVRQLTKFLRTINFYFGSQNLNQDCLDLAMREQGLICGDVAAPRKDAALIESLEYLLHIRRAEETIRRCYLSILQAFLKDEKSEQRKDMFYSGMESKLRELDKLLCQSNLFGGEDTFSLVHGLSGKIRYFLGIYPGDELKGQRYWKKTLEPEFKKAFKEFSREIDRLRQIA